MRLFAASLFLLLLGCGPSDEARMAAETSGFYSVYLTLSHAGIPGPQARSKLAPFISPSLEKLLADGAAAEMIYARKTNNQSPPIVEGDIFTSLFEGATAFHVGACEAQDAKGQCIVAFVYDDRSGKPVQWSDTVTLIRTDHGWRLDDIAYGGNWAFGNKGHLRETLAYAVKPAAEDTD